MNIRTKVFLADIVISLPLAVIVSTLLSSLSGITGFLNLLIVAVLLVLYGPRLEAEFQDVTYLQTNHKIYFIWKVFKVRKEITELFNRFTTLK